jgi:hypothetical protein
MTTDYREILIVPLINFKKSILLFCLYSPVCLANYVHATGEFYYGPDTDENTACEYAFNRAKQEAVQNYLGIEIESFTNENCESEKKCSIDVDTYTNFFGTIKRIVSRENHKYEEFGKKVCLVEIDAVVERIENQTNFMVEGDLKYMQGQELNFNIVSSVNGYVSVYNYYDSLYNKIHSFKIEKVNTQYKFMKDGYKIIAQLPKDKQQSKELLIFVFSEEKPKDKKTYDDFEFENMLSSLNSKVKRTIFRYITIGKKL